MKKHRSFLKRITYGSLAGVFFLLSLMAIVPQSVFAAGETYTWENDRVIAITGGDLTGTNKLELTVGNANQFMGQVTYQNKCIMRFTLITSADNKTAAQQAIGVTVIGAPGDEGKPSCDAKNQDGDAQFPGVIGGYNGKTVNIKGERTGEKEETDAQKRVTVTVNSPKSAEESPNIVVISIKKGGNNVDGPTDATQQVPGWESGNVPDDLRAVEYEATFTIDEGDYQACEVGVVNDCITFHKNKYEPLDLFMGESFADKDISVTIQANYYEPVNSRRELGPVDVTLQKADGSGAITTIQTDTNTLTPTDEQAVSTEYADIESFLRALFKNIAPGKYKICVPNLEDCQVVTKKDGETLEVVFKTRKIDLITSGYSRDPDERCPNVLRVWAISKIACPMATAAELAVQGLEDVFIGRIVVDVNNVFGSGTSLEQSDNARANYAAWNAFRTIAVAAIILFGVMMVISEAFGLAFMDSFTIRKLLPRLLIALIIIVISWWLLRAVVQIFNNLTVWAGTLITYPFQSFPEPNASAWTAVSQWTIITGLLAFVGPVVVLLFTITIFLAMLVATFVLILRQLVILLCILMAPLFILTFVVPNLSGIGNLWRSILFGALAMGPLFIMLAESGSVMYKVVGQKDPTGVLAALSMLIPLVAIPFVAVKVTGAAGKFLGLANQKTKGAFGMLSGARTAELTRRGELAKKGELFQGTFTRPLGLGAVSSRMNKITRGVSSGGFRRTLPLTRSGRLQNQAAMNQRAALMAVAQAKSPEGQAGEFNDYMLRAQTYEDEDEARHNMAEDWGMYARDENGEIVRDAEGNAVQDSAAIESGIQAAKANGGFGLGRGMFALEALAAGGSGFEDMPAMTKAIARMAGNNDAMYDDLAARMKKNLGRSRRGDLLAGAKTVANLARQEHAATQGSGAAPSASAYHAASMEAFDALSPGQFSYSRPEAIRNMSNTLRTELVESKLQFDTAQTSGNAEQFAQAQRRLGKRTAQVRNIQDTMHYMTPEGIKTFNQTVIQPDTIEGSPISNILKSTEERLSRETPEKAVPLYDMRQDRAGNIRGFSPTFEPRKNDAGEVVDFKVRQTTVPNPAYNPIVAGVDYTPLMEAYEDNRNRMSFDPTDINNNMGPPE